MFLRIKREETNHYAAVKGSETGNNLNNVRLEASRHFRNREKGVYLKDKINELATQSKTKDIRVL
jgi:hypothetical protein